MAALLTPRQDHGLPMRPLPRQLVAKAWERAVAECWGHRFGQVEVTYELVDPRSLASVIGLVATSTFDSARKLFHRFAEAGITPYQPVLLGGPSEEGLLLGPLVERHPNGLVILDGVHRCLAALRYGPSALCVAVLTTEVHPEPAGSLTPLGNVTPSDSTRTRTPLFRRTGNPDFRPTDVFLSRAQTCAWHEIERLRKQ